jgi:predicted GH43/DUF377 family glycosyl hydrolase
MRDDAVATNRFSVTARRLRDTPVVEFGAAAGYGPIFNAGVIAVDGVFHLFARGVRHGYRRGGDTRPRFVDYVSDVLVFTSEDGLDYRFQQVLATGADEGAYSLEDPRVQRVRSGGDEEVILTYTHLPAPESGQPWQVGLHRLRYEDGRFALNRDSGRIVGPAGVPDKDAVVFNLRDGRVALIHRIHPDIQLALFDSLEELYAPPAGYWDAHLRELDRHTLIRPGAGALGVGAGAPPVATEAGLLLFYHERGGDGRYTLRVALLDDESGELLALLPEPLLTPELEWERQGDVDKVEVDDRAVGAAEQHQSHAPKPARVGGRVAEATVGRELAAVDGDGALPARQRRRVEQEQAVVEAGQLAGDRAPEHDQLGRELTAAVVVGRSRRQCRKQVAQTPAGDRQELSLARDAEQHLRHHQADQLVVGDLARPPALGRLRRRRR